MLKQFCKILPGAMFIILATTAQALVYDCDIKSFSSSGFIPSRVVVSFNEGDDRAIVVDSYIMHVNKAPIAVELKVRDKNSYKLTWELDGVPLSNSRSDGLVLYSAVLHTGQRTLSISAILAGYDNDLMRGRGKCKVLKDK